MEGGPPSFSQGFSCPAILWIPARIYHLSPTGVLPPMPDLSRSFGLMLYALCRSSTPYYRSITVWASAHFARRYSGYLVWFLFLRVLRCFSSPGLPPFSGWQVFTCRVAPFGYVRIYRCLLFPVPFRSLPRPSSAPGAKASTVCPYSLNLRPLITAILLRHHFTSFITVLCIRLLHSVSCFLALWRFLSVFQTRHNLIDSD